MTGFRKTEGAGLQGTEEQTNFPSLGDLALG
jgi:hypothetical protein